MLSSCKALDEYSHPKAPLWPFSWSANSASDLSNVKATEQSWEFVPLSPHPPGAQNKTPRCVESAPGRSRCVSDKTNVPQTVMSADTRTISSAAHLIPNKCPLRLEEHWREVHCEDQRSYWESPPTWRAVYVYRLFAMAVFGV